MANSYTKAAFTLTVTAAEAALLNQVQCAAETLQFEEPEDAARAEAFAELGRAFATAFPPGDADPFAGFLALFDDAAYPALDCAINTGQAEGTDRVEVYFGGDQVSPGTLAALIRRTCPSALPCGFEYALDCDRLRAGEFGGGYVVITADGVDYHGSSFGLDRALARTQGEGADGFVLATRDRDHGLGFWNRDTGFGRLFDATVFTEAEAASFDVAVAGGAAEWLSMPAPLA